MEVAPGLSKGLGISGVVGVRDFELVPPLPEPPKLNGKAGRVVGPAPRLPACCTGNFRSFTDSCSDGEGEGIGGLRFGLGGINPDFGEASFDGKRGVNE